MSKNRQKRASFNAIFTSTFSLGGKVSQIACLLSFMFVLGVSSTTAADVPIDFPRKGKPIILVVPNAPGGTSDITARLVAPVLEKELGTPVQVVNKPGAGMQVGLTEAALAKPDGYTLAILALPSAIPIYLDPDRKAIPRIREMQAIASHNIDVITVAVNAQSPYRTIKDLVDAAKANPSRLKASTDGLMGIDHLMSIDFMKKTGTNFRFVHFDGGAKATTALAGGHVDLRIGKVGSVYAMAKSGNVRVIGVMDKHRSKYFPDAPTLEESGYKDMAYYQVIGLASPKGTPRVIVDILSNAMKKAVDTEEAKKRLDGVALVGHFMGPDEFDAYWKGSEKMMETLLLEAKKSNP